MHQLFVHFTESEESSHRQVLVADLTGDAWDFKVTLAEMAEAQVPFRGNALTPRHIIYLRV